MDNDFNRQVRAKKQKRYSSEEEILSAIDRANERTENKFKEAARFDLAADNLFKIGDPTLVENANYYRERARELRCGGARNEAKAKQLGNVLAQFRTQQLPGLDDGDASVPG